MGSFESGELFRIAKKSAPTENAVKCLPVYNLKFAGWSLVGLIQRYYPETLMKITELTVL